MSQLKTLEKIDFLNESKSINHLINKLAGLKNRLKKIQNKNDLKDEIKHINDEIKSTYEDIKCNYHELNRIAILSVNGQDVVYGMRDNETLDQFIDRRVDEINELKKKEASYA